MKKIINVYEVKNEGKLIIDQQQFHDEFELDYYIEQILYTAHVYEAITLKNFYAIPKALVKSLTPQYTRGCEIIIDTEAKNIRKSFKNKFPQKAYAYRWIDIDYSALPKSLAEHVFEYNGKPTKMLDALQSLKTLAYLPGEIWDAMDNWSQLQVQKVKSKNKIINYMPAEEWYKNMFKECVKHKMWLHSPNKKTMYEGFAEIDFEKQLQSLAMSKDEEITQKEYAFLQKYAPAYGVDIPKFTYKVNSRKTEHGYTTEPVRCCTPMTDSDIAQCIFDYRATQNLPGFVRKGLWQRSTDCPKLIKEAYERLTYYMQLGDDFLMPGWHRCPTCGEIYYEENGCENCGSIEPIQMLSAENLFYSNAMAFEDMESTTQHYRELMNALDTDADPEDLILDQYIN